MEKERPIDRKRDGAFLIKIGGDSGGGRVTSMLSIGDSLYAVTEKEIYEVRMADQIDPGRTNIRTPNTQQRVIGCGSDSPLVGKTILTAVELLKEPFISETYDLREAARLSFEILKDLAAMSEIVDEINAAEAAISDANGVNRNEDSSLTIPTIKNIGAKCKDVAQKADHALQSLLSMARVFYGEYSGRKWFEGLSEVVNRRHGEDDEFSKYVSGNLSFLKFMRNFRNSVEHPDSTKRIIVNDFEFTPAGEIGRPSIAIVHPETPMGEVAVSAFIGRMIESIANFTETTMAFIADRNSRPVAGFTVEVVEIPEDDRRHRHVRYSFGLCHDSGVVRVS